MGPTMHHPAQSGPGTPRPVSTHAKGSWQERRKRTWPKHFIKQLRRRGAMEAKTIGGGDMDNTSGGIIDARTAAGLLNWKLDRVRREARLGRIPAIRVGRTVVFEKRRLHDYRKALALTMGDLRAARQMVEDYRMCDPELG